MQHLDLQVVQQAKQWLSVGLPIWFCTVLKSYGSAPRGPGAMFVCLSTGEHRGSLSGGCVEEDFLERVCDGKFQVVSQVVRYGEGGVAPALSLPCGGVLDVLVEFITPTHEALSHLEGVEAALRGGSLLSRNVVIGTEIRSLESVIGNVPRIKVEDEVVSVRIGCVQRLLIAGLSPVAEFCASFAVSMGYEVILCDPREDVIAGFAMANVKVVAELPANFIARGGCHAATAVVALTHDPRLDDLTLMEAVRTAAFYVGAMGSARTSQKRFERLKRIGELDDETIARIHAPIGLRLGSKTPAEIAMAVMADILRVWNGIDRAEL